MAIPRGYLKIRKDSFGAEMRLHIKSRLTVVPVATSSFKGSPEPIRLIYEDGDFLGIPRGIYLEHLYRYDPAIEFAPSVGSNDMREEEAIKLRVGQPEIIDSAYAELTKRNFGGVIIQVPTGGGKTVLGTELARRLRLKTLVIVHTSVLMEQWIGEIEKFFPRWRIGRLQADVIDIEGKDIVVGMLQSVAFKEYDNAVYESFGTIVCDEVHVMGAPEFSKAFPKFPAKYVIGLSATPKRKDKAEDVFKLSIGKTISGMDTVKVLKPTIYFVNTEFAWTPQKWMSGEYDKQKPHIIRSLVKNPARNEIILRNVERAAEVGRQVLVLTERVAHAEWLGEQIEQRVRKFGASVGVLVGEKKKVEREASMKCDVIVGTSQLISVGFNEPRLDTLIFASPIQGVEQAIGRVLRVYDGKKEPLVIDLVDRRIPICSILAKSRWRKYRQKGWECKGTAILEEK